MDLIGIVMTPSWGKGMMEQFHGSIKTLSPEKHILVWWNVGGRRETGERLAVKTQGFVAIDFGDSKPTGGNEVDHAAAFTRMVSCALAFWDGEDKTGTRVLSRLKMLGLPLHITYTDPLVELARMNNSFL